jgi:hypothetical protein
MKANVYSKKIYLLGGIKFCYMPMRNRYSDTLSYYAPIGPNIDGITSKVTFFNNYERDNFLLGFNTGIEFKLNNKHGVLLDATYLFGNKYKDYVLAVTTYRGDTYQNYINNKGNFLSLSVGYKLNISSLIKNEKQPEKAERVVDTSLLKFKQKMFSPSFMKRMNMLNASVGIRSKIFGIPKVLYFSGSAMRFVANKFALGIGSNNFIIRDEKISTINQSILFFRYDFYSLGPFARYYLFQSRINPFIDGGVYIGYYIQKTPLETNNYFNNEYVTATLNGSAGINIQISLRFSMECKFQYYVNLNQGKSSFYDYEETHIGFNYHF